MNVRITFNVLMELNTSPTNFEPHSPVEASTPSRTQAHTQVPRPNSLDPKAKINCEARNVKPSLKPPKNTQQPPEKLPKGTSIAPEMAALVPETAQRIFTPEALRSAAKQSERCHIVPVRLRRAIKKFLRGLSLSLSLST